MIDIDFFKKFNDTYGHPAGDRLLKRVAAILTDSVRKGDLVARYGGEEFAVFLPQTDLNMAMSVAERIRTAISRENWEERKVTASLGVASSDPRFGLDVDLLNYADYALYVSKEKGRNRVSSMFDNQQELKNHRLQNRQTEQRYSETFDR